MPNNLESEKSKKLWGGIFEKTPPETIRKIIDSFSFDFRLANENFDVVLTHSIALSELGIIPKTEIAKMLSKKEKIISSVLSAEKSEFEDVHSALEFFISKEIGEKIGFNLRLGRSRNDEVITTVHLWVLRNFYSSLLPAIKKTAVSILESANRNFGIIIPLYTHLRQAQPILFSHLILGYLEGFIRCVERFRDTLKRFDVCHLGSGAGSGTGVKLDVEKMTKILGFSRISRNSIDSTSRRDILAELIFDFCMTAILFSKIAEDLIFLSADEIKFVELSEEICTGSSMMPQKKNPDVLELMRGKSARFVGFVSSILSLEKGLPSGYSKDLQEDKIILFEAWDEIKNLLTLAESVFDGIYGRHGKISPHTLATDFAETLSLSKKIDYRTAHKITGKELKEKGTIPQEISYEDSIKRKVTPQSTNPNLVKKKLKLYRNIMEDLFKDISRFLEKFSEENFNARVKKYLG